MNIQKASRESTETMEPVKEEEGGGVAPGKATTTVKRVRTGPTTNKTSLPKAEIPNLRYSDLGGLEGVLEEIKDLVERPFRYPEIYKHLGVEPPRGILLHGAPGSGKTSLAMAIAGELGVALLKISAPELVSGMSGESEGRIRELFDQAKVAAPCILFLDEIDAITPKRETAQREMERRIVAQLLTCMDDLGRSNALVMVIGATNRPDSLDPALRRAGRLDRELQLSIPNEEGRMRILEVLCSRMRLCGTINLRSIARNTPGYVGADLKALTQEAANVAIRRIFLYLDQRVELVGHQSITRNDWKDTSKFQEDKTTIMFPEQNESPDDFPKVEGLTFQTLECCPPPSVGDQKITSDGENSLVIVKSPSSLRRYYEPLSTEMLERVAAAIEPMDFEVAMGKIQPSAKREGFAVAPDTRWEDIGALKYVRDELRMAVVEPIRHPDKFSAVGISAPAGVLLWGPPGCGKTLLAKAVANESHSNFISVKGPELLNKYVGESERAVRQVFERARHSAPCIVFFDELDALCPRRSDEADSATSRVVNQLLTEMDGLESRRQVFVLAATNRPDMIDPAMTRPGRLDKLLYVNLPSPTERVEILRAVSRSTPWESSVDLVALANDPRCDNFSGADLASLVREASLAAVREAIERDYSMRVDHNTVSIITTEVDNPNNNVTSPILTVTPSHIEAALSRVSPSVSPKDLAAYEQLHRLRMDRPQ